MYVYGTRTLFSRTLTSLYDVYV